MSRQHKTKSQHYVPQFYLARFEDLKGKIWVYDKKKDAKFASDKRNLAQENYFYDLDESVLKTEDQKAWNEYQLAEKALAAIEGQGARSFKIILSEIGKNDLRRSLRKELATFAVIQHLRTKASRDETVQMTNAMLKVIASAAPPDSRPNEGEEVVLAPESYAVAHLQMLFNEDLWKQMSQAMVRHSWILAKAPLGSSFWTSDHPVAIHPHIIGQRKSHAGVASEGVEIAYPLSSQVLLLMKERTFHGDARKLDAKSIELKPPEVQFYNELQVRHSDRFVYSSADNLEQAEAYCNAHPEFREVNPQKIELYDGPLYDNEGNFLGDVVQFRKSDN